MSCLSNVPTLAYVQSLESRIQKLEACCQENNTAPNNNQSNNLNPEQLNKLKFALENGGDSGIGLLEGLGMLTGLAGAIYGGVNGGVDFLKQKGQEIGGAIKDSIENKSPVSSQDFVNQNLKTQQELETLRNLVTDLINTQENIKLDIKSVEGFAQFNSDSTFENEIAIGNLKGQLGNFNIELERTNKQIKNVSEASASAKTTALEALVLSKLNESFINRIDQDIIKIDFQSISNVTDIETNTRIIEGIRSRVNNLEKAIPANATGNIDITQNITITDILRRLNSLENSNSDNSMNRNDLQIILNDGQQTRTQIAVLNSNILGTNEAIGNLNGRINNLDTNVTRNTNIFNQIDNNTLNRIDRNTTESLIELGAIGATVIGTNILTKNNGEIAKSIQQTATSTANNLQDNFNKLKNSRALSMSLDAINLAVNIHNALMLSRNLGESLIAMIESVGTAIGLRDLDGNPLDLRSTISNTIDNMIRSVVGAENYNELSRQFAQLNRIYQAGANMIDTVHNIIDDTTNLATTTLEHTGKIGNALLDAGVVLENAYAPMQEELDRINSVNSRFQKILDRIQTTEDVVSNIDSIANDVISIQENISEFQQNQIEFKQAITDFETSEQLAKDTEKTSNLSTAIIEDTDLILEP